MPINRNITVRSWLLNGQNPPACQDGSVLFPIFIRAMMKLYPYPSDFQTGGVCAWEIPVELPII